MNKVVLIFLFLLLTQTGFSQGTKCTTIDSNLCYVKAPYPITDFAIEKKWESEDEIEAIQTPLLADINGDCIPEIIVGDKRISDGQLSTNRILILDSKTGKTIQRIQTPNFRISPTSIAIADIDEDSIPEIFLAIEVNVNNPNHYYKLFCYNIDGSIRWISDETYIADGFKGYGATPALADFNKDGIPEIYIVNKIFNATTGVLLAAGGKNGIGGDTWLFPSVTIAAELDGDLSSLELAAGYTVYKVNITNPNGQAGNSMTPQNIMIDNEYRDGNTTIGDINLDGVSDIVVSSIKRYGTFNKEIVLYTYTVVNGFPQLIGKTLLTNPKFHDSIGSPFIGNTDNSGKPSIIVTSTNIICCFKYNGTDTLDLIWSINNKDAYGNTGITIFDFNNDGIQEILYRDQHILKIINASVIPPIDLDSLHCKSGTLHENPIIGSLGGTNDAKICVTCAEYLGVNNARLTVFGAPDSLPGWAPARGIWNQYNYHILNINDDLTVPKMMKNNATYKNGKYNNFFVQESLLDSNGMYNQRAANLYGNINCVDYNPQTKEYTATFDLINSYDASKGATDSISIAFYSGNPETTGTFLGIYYTSDTLFQDDTLKNLIFTFFSNPINQLFMVINTKKKVPGIFTENDFELLECDYTDNISQAGVLPVVEEINDSICNSDSYFFIIR